MRLYVWTKDKEYVYDNVLNYEYDDRKGIIKFRYIQEESKIYVRKDWIESRRFEVVEKEIHNVVSKDRE